MDLSTAFSVHFLCFIKLRDAKSKCIDSSFKMWEIRFFAQLAARGKTAPQTNTAPVSLAFYST